MTTDAAAPAILANTRRRWLNPLATKQVAQYSGVLLLGAALAILAHRFVQLRGADTDLFPRWFALRELLLHGRNPYDAAVTADIAAHTALAVAPEAIRAAYGFIYPLPGALLLTPLAILPYDWAATLWLTAALIALPTALLVAASTSVRSEFASPSVRPELASTTVRPELIEGRGSTSPPRTIAQPGVIAALLLSIPTLWNLALIQPGLAVPPLVALALWQRTRRPAFAGAALAAATLLKPQWVLLLAPSWLTIHALRAVGPPTSSAARSRRFLAGAAVTALALCAIATLLVPTWPAHALAAATAYARVGPMATTSPAVYVLLTTFLPDAIARPTAAALIAALLAWTARAVLGGEHPERGVRRAQHHGDLAAAARSLVVGPLVVPPAWETGAIMLLLPLAATFGTLPPRTAFRFALATLALSIVLALLPLLLPWRSGALTTLAYAALWLLADRLTTRSAAAPDAASPPPPPSPAPR